MFNISFCGKAGSGKTTAANYLCAKYSYTRISFADRLKEIATKACRMQGKDRELLQKLGVEIRKDQEDFWVNAAFKKIKGNKGPYVIDDMRFGNEYTKCLYEGFKVFRIVRSRKARIESFGLDENIRHEFESHESETALDDMEMPWIVNRGTVEELYKDLDLFVQEV